MRTITAIVVLTATLLASPAIASPPLVGGGGLTINAANLANYVLATYPGVKSIGGVRPCDAIGDHCRGVAIDIMVGGNTGLGDQIHSDLVSNKSQWGIKYTLWRVAAHHDHIPVTVS